MKSLISTIIILTLVLLGSYLTILIFPPCTETLTTTYQENNNNIQTYVIGQEPSGRDMLIHTIRETEPARQRNLRYIQREEEIEKCIKKKTKNWKRTHYKRSYEKEYDEDKEEWILTNEFYEKKGEFHGFHEDEDWKLRFKLKNRALDGEEIC